MKEEHCYKLELRQENLQEQYHCIVLQSKNQNKFVLLYASENVTKMENSLIAILDKYPVLYIVQPDFGATLKIHKKSNFDQNQLTFSTQHKYMYMHQKKL